MQSEQVTTGPEQLRDWIGRRFPESARPQRDAAEYFGWDETFLSRLLAGRQTLGLTNAIFVERKTGIPVEAWASSELDKALEPSVANARKRR